MAKALTQRHEGTEEHGEYTIFNHAIYQMKKIAVIFGTRPEAIKLCPVVLALKADPSFDCQVCVTGQHREMLQQVLEVFGVEPDVDLALMQPNQTLAGLTARAMTALDEYLSRVSALKP